MKLKKKTTTFCQGIFHSDLKKPSEADVNAYRFFFHHVEYIFTDIVYVFCIVKNETSIKE